MSYLSIAKAAESRMRMERDPEMVLAEAYRRYWNTPETEPMATFVSLHREIDLLENQVGVETAWQVLVAAARTWYQEHRTCPFCKHPDVLHLASDLSR